MSFYPDDQPIPEELRTDEFVLRPLTPAHVHLDYAALMVSKEMLRLWSGTSWPEDDFTVAQNLEDLEMHDREHQERVAFTYTVLSPDERECLGCVYINPLTNHQERNKEELTAVLPHTANIGFWVKQPRLADKLDARLLAALLAWFEREWSFTAVTFNTNEHNSQQIALLEQAGLRLKYKLNMPRRTQKYLIYA